MKNLAIEAPDDVQVETIDVLDGPIKKGQRLLVLKSFNLDRFAIHLALFKEHIDIIERPFLDGRVQAEIDELNEKVALLHEIVSGAEREVRIRNEYYKLTLGEYTTLNPPPQNIDTLFFFPMESTTTSSSTATSDGSESQKTSSISTLGDRNKTDGSSSGTTHQTTTTTQNSVTQSKIVSPDWKSDQELQTNLDRAKIEYGGAKLDADKAGKHLADALDKIKLARRKLAEYEALLAAQQAAMTITSSYEGTFSSRVALGSFVRKGHLLGSRLN
ncbi:hypothetical protein [Bradyrhizobium elkanii]|uniref:Uncharacterized protein n=1 Tax=Bradyrhizobium elkanii TaxID=29448 RepID=A0ABV4F007_BRAEL|nr:hypothetical protein [Bradyrhizobium elkanii]MCP1757774.1 hypothetical protein [Bradyrhizobium elkanii]MCS3881929.1 hypothetical protein [Bradyrhizobium elkanii]MCS4218689.1 hypothetical protein [Bradyrhizobium elkanii]MCW2201620.1 hypothetical protein [Bradyrhizobium elkanii]MCW2226734.1 hypothetical protein [Bradyrhizobium elkanii]